MPHAAFGRALGLLAVAFCLGGQTTMYKWVDEKGVTHFSQDPPPDRKAAKIEARPQPRMSDAPVRTEGWKEREMDARKRRLERDQAEEAQRTRSERDAAVRRDRCLKAQRELHVLQRGVPIYSINARGEREYLEDKDRPAEIEAWKRVAEAHCER